MKIYIKYLGILFGAVILSGCQTTPPIDDKVKLKRYDERSVHLTIYLAKDGLKTLNQITKVETTFKKN